MLDLAVWALKDGTLGQAVDRDLIEPPAVRDPDSYALKPKHVRQITKNLRGDAKSWKPPAGLYVENSKAGLNLDLWALRRSKNAPSLEPRDAAAPSTGRQYAAGLPSKTIVGPATTSKGASPKELAELATPRESDTQRSQRSQRSYAVSRYGTADPLTA